MKKITISIFSALYCFIIVSWTYAAWQGPTSVLEGGWGSAQGQFGIVSGDTTDEFPSMVAISSSGRILIGDGFNKRIQIFNIDGTINKIITPSGFPTTYRLITYWPLSLYICGDQNIYTERNEYIQIYDMGGGLIKNLTNLDGGIVYVDQQCNFYTHNPSANRYTLYSPIGQLIKTSTTRPLELGVVKEQTLSSDKYKITVSYPERVYSLVLSGPYERYIRDVNGYLYALSGKLVKKFNVCGRELGTLTLPENQVTIIPPVGQGFEERAQLIAQYGQPVIAPNGDVYTWKRTPDKYSILKWTWVDDPNVPTGPDAPTNLGLTPSINGLYLTWKASPNDPGCVTKYEIARSTTSGGVFSTIDTVEKGVLKYNDTTAETGTTYYYKVRAMAGSDPSAYTAEVAGKR